MPIPSRITDFSATAASNFPGGTESIGTSLDDYLRAYQAVTRGDLAHKGADIASAATTDLGAVLGSSHSITGTTTITSFGTVASGIWKMLTFSGALTLTHNATSLILPGGANITTAAGDTCFAESLGSGNWRVHSYFKASTAPFGTALAVTEAMINTGAVTEAKLGASAVSQGKLKTALNTITPGLTTGAQSVLSGGRYCFLPTVEMGAGSGADVVTALALSAINAGGGAVATIALETTTGLEPVRTLGAVSSTRSSETTTIQYTRSGDDVATIRVLYVNASPPYDLGDGEVPLFVFVQMDANGQKHVWTAPDPTWAHNGPTDISPHFVDGRGRGYRRERVISNQDRLDLRDPAKRDAAIERIAVAPYELIEITPQYKNRDMALIPHPFVSAPADSTIVMIPVCALLEKLAMLHEGGESLGALIQQGHIVIGNEPLERCAPPGVLPVSASWKLT